MKTESITAINETAKTAGATIEAVVKDELFGKVKTVVEPSVAKKVVKGTLIGAGVLALVAGGFYGYKVLKKTKSITIVTDETSSDPAVDVTVDETAA